jgi:hypothetical protein
MDRKGEHLKDELYRSAISSVGSARRGVGRTAIEAYTCTLRKTWSIVEASKDRIRLNATWW